MLNNIQDFLFDKIDLKHTQYVTINRSVKN